MATIKLTKDNIDYLNQYYPSLKYNEEENTIQGILPFKLQFDKIDEVIEDSYSIEVDLNNVSEDGMPIVRETGNKIIGLAKEKKIRPEEFHLNNLNGEMCMIIPPKIKERYPNGFDLIELINHIQEHLFWVSYFAKYNKAPWKGCGHSEVGYLELYLENKELYKEDVKKYFKCSSRHELRRKIKELKKTYKL